MKYNYEWTLKDAVFTKDKGKVFSCFACGGGSTMGYKLAGYDVIGCNEIDPRMMEVYKINHNPKYSYCEPIQTFKNRDDLPAELYDLDILDGSPPCSSFSMVGNRETDWGKEKKFREGQSKQVLDTLFFDFIDLAKKLQPKIVVAENVKGLLLGEAIQYVVKINEAFDQAGYYVQRWLLDASTMGVPQKHERVFFIALRKDLAGQFMEQADLFHKLPELILDYDETPILFKEIKNNITENPKLMTSRFKNYWDNKTTDDDDLGTIVLRIEGKQNNFGVKLIKNNQIPKTIVSSNNNILYDEPRYLDDKELIKISTFPSDYNFLNNQILYIVGMSVPPVMTARIADDIYNQWLSKINKEKDHD